MIDVTFRSPRSSSSVHAPWAGQSGKDRNGPAFVENARRSEVSGERTIFNVHPVYIQGIYYLRLMCTINHLPTDVLKACIEPWIVESPRKRLREGIKSAKAVLNRNACAVQSHCMR